MFVSAEKLYSTIRARVVLLAGAAVLAASAGGWFLTRGGAAASPPQPALETVNPPAPAGVLVFVSGAVAHPGLYELSTDARVADAVAAAGGITSLADPGHLPNLASRVHDGRQVNVPFRKSTVSAALKLDVNTAAQDELDAVPGMPPGLAAAIVQFRSEWGPFTTLSQLHTDLGVDTATVTGLRAYLRVVPPGQ